MSIPKKTPRQSKQNHTPVYMPKILLDETSECFGSYHSFRQFLANVPPLNTEEDRLYYWSSTLE